MFKNLFKRVKATPATVAPPESVAPASAADSPDESPPKTFREKWDERWETGGPLPTPEVVEGNGGNTDWGMWTDAVENQDDDGDDSFAATVPAPLAPE